MTQHQYSTTVPSHMIIAGDNDRKRFKEASLRELADSIETHGIAQVPTYRRIILCQDGARLAITDKSREDAWKRLRDERPIADGREIDDHALHGAQAMYEIIAGERRTRAMRDILGWTDIPCQIHDYDDEQASGIMLAENTNRVDLDAIEEAQAYAKRLDEGWDIADIAKVAGRSEGIIKNRLALLSLVPEAQHLVKHGNLPLGHAQAMGELDNNRQRMVLEIYNKSQHMPLTRWQDIIRQYLEAQIAESQQSLFDLSSIHEQLLADAEQHQAARKGKDAVTGAPVNDDLPAIRWHMKDKIGDVLDRWTADLQQAGRHDEAAVVGTLYNTLVALNWTTCAIQPALPVKTSEATCGDLSHEAQIK